MVDIDSIFTAAEERRKAHAVASKEAADAEQKRINAAGEFTHVAEGWIALTELASRLRGSRCEVSLGNSQHDGKHRELPQRAWLRPRTDNLRGVRNGSRLEVRHDGERATVLFGFGNDLVEQPGTWDEAFTAAAGKLLDTLNGVPFDGSEPVTR